MKAEDVSRRRNGSLEVDILVSPRSNRSGPEGYDQWRRRMIVRVKAPPLDGRANKEVEELFREITGMPSQVTSGHLNRQKTVTVSGDPDRILSILDGVNVG
ncbi:MAG: YggU family protein [Candidatus Methanomethylophilaceae archaeon]|nr:YggU family protein [Candidatus Methanomethylophilaceae archaeon]MBR7152385.1 YggU family protein [Candidatus Methanomethylophilaceae archaeon]